MIASVTSFLQAVSLVVQAILVVFLLRGHIRRYPLLLFYSILQLALAVTEAVVLRVNNSAYAKVYWTDEVVLDLFLFLMVILLVYRALEGSALKAMMGRVLAAVVVIVVVVPFILFSARRFSTAWFNGTSQLLNFGAAILNLGLWTALIGTKKRDPLLLSVSAGLGIAVTGAAIAYGLRQFTTAGGSMRDLANLFKTITYLASVLIWCWAFRPSARKNQTPAASASVPS